VDLASPPQDGDLLLEAGQLQVEASPPGALQWIDDSFEGRTGGLVRGLTPGPHRLRLYHPDRPTAEFTLEILAGEVTSVSHTLEQGREAILAIGTEPPGARVKLDGIDAGVTPWQGYGREPGQTLRIEARKLGFKPARWEVPVKEGGLTLHERLTLSPRVMHGYLGATSSGAGRLRGWPAGAILEEGVVGEPLREPDDRAAAAAMVGVSFPLGRVHPFYEILGTTEDPYVNEASSGFRILAHRGSSRRQCWVGLATLRLTAEESDPPTGSRGSEDRTRPLEEWSHPIPNVLVGNGSEVFFLGQVLFRPTPTLFAELRAGPLTDGRLRGTALVSGEDGSLVRAPGRRYDFEARDGLLAELTVDWAAGRHLSFWKLSPTSGLRLAVRWSRADYGVAGAEGLTVFLGLGGLTFWD
jgi:hypothetical protein